MNVIVVVSLGIVVAGLRVEMWLLSLWFVAVTEGVVVVVTGCC